MAGKGGFSEDVSMQLAERISRINPVERIIKCRRAVETPPFSNYRSMTVSDDEKNNLVIPV